MHCRNHDKDTHIKIKGRIHKGYRQGHTCAGTGWCHCNSPYTDIDCELIERSFCQVKSSRNGGCAWQDGVRHNGLEYDGAHIHDRLVFIDIWFNACLCCKGTQREACFIENYRKFSGPDRMVLSWLLSYNQAFGH